MGKEQLKVGSRLFYFSFGYDMLVVGNGNDFLVFFLLPLHSFPGNERRG